MSLPLVTTILNTRNIVSVLGLSLAITAGSAYAGEREQARRMYDRLAGVPPTNAELNTMVPLLTAGGPSYDPYAAAEVAMANPNFLNVTIKNMVIPWTNKDQTVFAPFNDTAATLVGYIKDGRDFRGILSDDIVYIAQGAGISSTYSNNNNNLYEEVENENHDLASVLVADSQSLRMGIPSNATAGVLTTRQSAQEFFYLGTNRAMFRFAMMNYLCKDLEQLKDTTRVPDRIRKDVSRSPGGDSSVFLNNCISCHAGMDGLAGAFAYYDWIMPVDGNGDPIQTAGTLTYNQTAQTYDLDGTTVSSRVTKKHRHNSANFKYGYDTMDDSFINYWRTGVNANLGWDGTDGAFQPVTNPQIPTSGFGAKALGQELANTDAFARCQVTKVYRHVCFNDPDQATLQTLMGTFQTAYNLRDVVKESAIQCMGN